MINFSNPSVSTFVFGAQKNRLFETVLLLANNMFWLRNKKNTFNYTFFQNDLIPQDMFPHINALIPQPTGFSKC